MIDRFGDAVDLDTPENPKVRAPHNPDCRKGWLGTDLDGRMIPCLICKPHLRKTVHAHNFSPR